MRFFTTLACAGIAAGAVAKKIAPVGWDKYADERQGQVEAAHHVHAREAEAAWEHAHGGKAPSYEAFEHQEGHYVPRSVEHGHEEDFDYSLEGYDHKLAADYKSTHHGVHARDVPEFEDEEIDTSLDGYSTTPGLHARDIPDFGEQEIDVSLDGYGHSAVHARSDEEVDEDEFEGDEIDMSLDGYSTTPGIHARDIPDFGDDDVDVSLEGFGEPSIYARDVDEDEFEGDEIDMSLDGYSTTPGLHARDIPDFGDDEVDVSLEGFGEPSLEGRSAPTWGDKLSEWVSGHHTASSTHLTHENEHKSTAWPKPTHVARAIKEAAEHLKHQVVGTQTHTEAHHHARSEKVKPVKPSSYYPSFEDDHEAHHHHARSDKIKPVYHAANSHAEHEAHHYAREAAAEDKAAAYRAAKAQAQAKHDAAYHQEANQHHAREAEPRMPIAYGNNQLLRQKPKAHLRPLVARDAEPAHVAFSHEHTATKTAAASKTGGWGFPW